jgi:exodeoxyribonuclease X
MKAIVFDTETTGFDAPECIELAWQEVDLLRVEETRVTLYTPDKHYHEQFMPSKPIELGALATHHIIMDDLQGCRPSSEAALST